MKYRFTRDDINVKQNHDGSFVLSITFLFVWRKKSDHLDRQKKIKQAWKPPTYNISM